MNAVISSWLISLVGVVILGILIDLILPDGQMQKYIKSIFSIVVVVVMTSPILKIDINEIDFDKFIYNEVSVELNDNYLNNYNENYKIALEKVLMEELNEKGFSNVNVFISYNLSNYNFEIEKVELNIKNLVINVNQVHIDKYKEMRSLVATMLNIKEGKIVIYE